MTAVAVALIGGLSLLAAPAFAAPDPAGDNGTVKIDRLPFDSDPDNQPHVGCQFQVDFYGFDEGDLNAEVTFTAFAPTLPEGGRVLLTDTVFIGEDSSAGGGSVAGLDASETYTLDFTGITAHLQQGFHVKLTVHADGARGADTKYKVFWGQDCAGNGGTTSTSSSTSSSTTTTLGATSSSGGGSKGAGGGSSSTLALSGGLPDTGSNAVPMMVVGLAMLGLGAASLLVSHWRQRHSGA